MDNAGNRRIDLKKNIKNPARWRDVKAKQSLKRKVIREYLQMGANVRALETGTLLLYFGGGSQYFGGYTRSIFFKILYELLRQLTGCGIIGIFIGPCAAWV